MTRCAVMQPTYAPWAGYMAMLDTADAFVILDTVAFSRQSWQQRNRVRLPDGRVVWLTVPVTANLGTRLDQVVVADTRWQRKHWATLTQAYSRTDGWDTLAERLAPVYTQPWERLADLNEALIRHLADHIGIDTPIVRASTLGSTRAGKIERLQDLLALTDSDTLIEPVAGTYLADAPFPVEWFNYEPVEYPQGGMEWCSHLSVIDLVAHNGQDSLDVIRGNVVSRS